MTNSIRDIRALGHRILKNGGVENAGFELRCLLEHICSVSETDAVIYPEKAVDTEAKDKFISACKRRAAGEPLQYILGQWEFMGLEFFVDPSVLIPRADTETLIDYILESRSGSPKILDLCCGSGCIGLSLKHFLPKSRITLADISHSALKTAKKNAGALGLDVHFVQADVLDGFEKYFSENEFDIIVSNPPYIKSADIPLLQREVLHEPRIALDGGEDGMLFYRAITEKWAGALRTGGEMIVETGFDTANEVYSMFIEYGYGDVLKARDLGGIVRLVSAKKGI